MKKILISLCFFVLFSGFIFDEKNKIEKVMQIQKNMYNQIELFRQEVEKDIPYDDYEKKNQCYNQVKKYSEKIYSENTEEIKKLLENIYKKNPKSKYAADALFVAFNAPVYSDMERLEQFVTFKSNYINAKDKINTGNDNVGLYIDDMLLRRTYQIENNLEREKALLEIYEKYPKENSAAGALHSLARAIYDKKTYSDINPPKNKIKYLNMIQKQYPEYMPGTIVCEIASAYLEKKDYKTAESILNDFITNNIKSKEIAYAYIQLGHVYRESKRTQKANETYRLVREKYPKDADFYDVEHWIDYDKKFEEKYGVKVKIVDGWSWRVEGGYIYCVGQVKNVSKTYIQRISLGFKTMDDSGNIIDTTTTYISIIAPGLTKPFKTIMNYYGTEKTVSVWVQDYASE